MSAAPGEVSSVVLLAALTAIIARDRLNPALTKPTHSGRFGGAEVVNLGLQTVFARSTTTAEIGASPASLMTKTATGGSVCVLCSLPAGVRLQLEDEEVQSVLLPGIQGDVGEQPRTIAANSADVFRGARSAVSAQGSSWGATVSLVIMGARSAARAGFGSPQRRRGAVLPTICTVATGLLSMP